MNKHSEFLPLEIMFEEITSKTKNKLDQLHTILDELESVVVTYSGGVDSTYLLHAAHERLGERAVGLTIVSPSLPESELDEAKAIATQIGAHHILIEGHETEDPNYLANTPQRCYFCKTETFDLAAEYASLEGYQAIVDGTNADDVGDHRPGRKAAREHGVRSPLMEAGLTKAEIRVFSRQAGLPSWDKPALACLASRIPYGIEITRQKLRQIENAETFLYSLGVIQSRVRHHGETARIEVEDGDMDKLVNKRQEVVANLKRMGFKYVTLDLQGYRSGSMNEVLNL